ncbi:MAG: aminotransferase class I/II-fold pyridoxal phosphate-dependent enzyme [Candidatus Omnitrophica bacterium]|nr:aminotransferase class I/II-fold pyridoxal phosphate-dependent enzyme [Candidatus Omnitrophota bacterium]
MEKSSSDSSSRSQTPPSFSTRAIHAGESRSRCADSMTTPIFQTSTFTFKNSRHIEEYTQEGQEHYEYGRYGNPTAQVAERRLADLEGAEDCIVFSSGMSAITTTILALIQSGDHIVFTDDSYKKTLEFCNSFLKKFGVECTIVSFGDYDALDQAVKKNTRFIVSESPTNPYLNIFDLVKLKAIADKHGVMTLIDSTFSTPYNQRPIEFGIDLVLQSATKYLAGHNDVLAGAVLGRKEMIDQIRNLHKIMGGILDPQACYLLIRGLKTFPLRVQKQNESTLKIAHFLENHPKIKRVYYPFLESHPHYKIAVEQMSGGGGVVSFEIKGDLQTAKRFLDSLKLCTIGPSLGGVETLITHPAMVSYYDFSKEEREQLGISDTLFRLAVGIEEADDIIEDLNQGLNQ